MGDFYELRLDSCVWTQIDMPHSEYEAVIAPSMHNNSMNMARTPIMQNFTAAGSASDIPFHADMNFGE
jgi:hypothetical protein